MRDVAQRPGSGTGTPAPGRPRWPEDLAPLRDRLDAVFRAVAFRSAVGAELDDWGLGWARVSAVPSATSANLAGSVHGGLVAALADLAFETACNSYGRLAVATQLSAHYAAPAPVDATLIAEADEVTRSRRIASYRVVVSSGETTVAWFQAVAYRSERWHLDEADFPEDWRRRS